MSRSGRTRGGTNDTITPAGTKNVILWILLLALTLRIAIALLSAPYIDRLYDIESFKMYGEAVSAGENPYLTIGGRSNYPPLWPLAMGGIAALVGTGDLFVFLYKFLITLADLGIVWLLFRMAPRPWNTWAALLYAFHPASLLVTGVQGQFDSIAAFFLLATIYIIEQRTRLLRRVTNEDLAALILGIGILVKIYPVFLLPLLLFKAKQRWRTFILASLPTAVFFLPFVFTPEGIRAVITNVLGYSGGFGEWGLGLFATQLSLDRVTGLLAAWGTPLVLLAMLISAWAFRILPFRVGALGILLAFFIFTQGYGVQYLIWPLALASLALTWKAWAYLAGSALAAIGFFAGNLLTYWSVPLLTSGEMHVLDISMRVLLWVLCVVWWVVLIRHVPTRG